MASRVRRPPSSTRRARRRGRRNAGSDLGARVLIALPAILFAIVIVAQGGIVFALGVGALGLVCLHELFQMLGGAHPSRLAGFLGLVGLMLAANYGSQFQVLLVAVALVPVLFGLVLMQPRAGTLSIAVTMMGVYWIGMALAHAVLLRKLEHGDGIVIDVLVGTFLGDTGAYLGGRLFGTAPLAPRISPNKTMEGLGIGVLTAVVAVWFAGLYQDWLTGANALLLGVGVAIAAPIGDLFESYVKRDAGTKDTGRFFGVHGGALDRLDAVLFTAVVGYYIWAAMV
jgi:phosphatidate cytidylyltransferase